MNRAQDASSVPDASAVSDDPSVDTLASALIAWAEQHGRHDLPWQLDPSPYRVWVSEIMLQQTQVAIVIPYYQRFMARFPNIAALAAAPLDDVLHAWTGLGYYARARNLHRAARVAVERYGGCLPERFEDMTALPGIGRSTAGAILALSRGLRRPILDGNARRVLARVFAVDGDPGASATQSRLWALADACMPHQGVAAYTQAIMDLGATVCLRTQPRCHECPLRGVCTAYRRGRQHELPSPRRRRARPRRTAWALVIRDPAGRLLLQRRPAPGVWGGLWSLPQFGGRREALAWLAAQFPESSVNPQALEPQRHTFTHYDLDLRLLAARVKTQHQGLDACAWYDPRCPARLGLSKAATRLVDTLCQ